ncbi:hypothetical protein FOL47_010956 [Perkinsus chesapeaki]|uniref:Uncharacterized protein n=1 Tax=Perkinsus chesapeaki TaxID=330153 RepID=A0A7J6N1L0_PERCH|nr:hypothetical protein FOL47_010956 [Perkinsus chesapeaki]
MADDATPSGESGQKLMSDTSLVTSGCGGVDSVMSSGTNSPRSSVEATIASGPGSGILYFNFVDTRVSPAVSPKGGGKSSAAVVDAATAAASGRGAGGRLMPERSPPSTGPRYAFCVRSDIFSQYYVSESRFADALIIPATFDWPLELCLVVQPGPGVPFPSTLPWYCRGERGANESGTKPSKASDSPRPGKAQAEIVGEPLKVREAGRGGHMVDRWVQFTHDSKLLEVRIQYSVCKAWDIYSDPTQLEEASRPAVEQILKMVNDPAGVLPYALYHVASVANSDKTALILMHAMDYNSTLRFFGRLSEQEVFRVSAGDRPVRRLLYLFSKIGCFLRAFVTVYRRRQLKEYLTNVQAQVHQLAAQGSTLTPQQRLNKLQNILNRLLEALVDFTTTQLPRHFFHDLDDACRPNFSNSNLVIGGVLCVHVCSAVLAMPRQLEFVGKDDPISPVAAGIWLALLRATFLFYLMLSEQLDPVRIFEYIPDEIYTLVRGVGFDVRAKANIQFQMRILQSRGLQPPDKSDRALETSAAAEVRMTEKAGALLRDMLSEKLYDVTKVIHNRPEFIPQGFSVRELMLQLAKYVKARKPEGSTKARISTTKAKGTAASTDSGQPEKDIVQVTPNGICDRSSIGSFDSIVARVEPLFQRSLQWSKRDLIESNIMQGISIVRRTAKPLEALLSKRKPLSQMIAEGRLPKNYIDQLFPDELTPAPLALPPSPLRRRSSISNENSPNSRDSSSPKGSAQRRRKSSSPSINNERSVSPPSVSAKKSPSPPSPAAAGRTDNANSLDEPKTATETSAAKGEPQASQQPIIPYTKQAETPKAIMPAPRAQGAPQTKKPGSPAPAGPPPTGTPSGGMPLPELPEDGLLRQHTGGSNTPILQRGAFTPQKAVATPFLQLLDSFCKKACGAPGSENGGSHHGGQQHTGPVHYFHQYHLHEYHRSVHHNAPQVVQLTSPIPPGSPAGLGLFDMSYPRTSVSSGSLAGSDQGQTQQQQQQQPRPQRQGQPKASSVHGRQKKRRH